LSEHVSLDFIPSALRKAFTIRAWSRRKTVRQTCFHSMECQSGVRFGKPHQQAISAADMSACLPESVSQGFLVKEHPREVSRFAVRGSCPWVDSPSIRSITERHGFASPHPFLRCLISVLCSSPSLAGDNGVLRSPPRHSRVRSCPRPVVHHPRRGNSKPLVPDQLPFGQACKHLSACSLDHGLYQPSPELTCPGLLAPDRLDAGRSPCWALASRPSRIEVTVVPQASGPRRYR